MSLIRQTFQYWMLVSFLFIMLQIANLLADTSEIGLEQVLHGFGCSILEPCASGEMDGQCWWLSILLALENSQKYSLNHKFLALHTSTSRAVQDHLNQHRSDESVSADWQPAHQLNAMLAHEYGLTILTIEVSDQGLLHIVLTVPSDTGHEQQVIFFGEIEQLLVSDFQIAQTLQQLLLTADISLVLTPGHVQPIVLMQYDHQFDEPEISLPVPIINSPARMLMLSEIMSYSPKAEWRLRPDFNAHYGAPGRRLADPNNKQKEVLKKVLKEKDVEYRKYKVSVERWKFVNRSIKALVTVLAAGAGYIYREPIIRFIQPYWDNRAHYYYVMTITLSRWGDSLKANLEQFGKTAYPYWVLVQNKGSELLNRYYWQQDASACINGEKISIQADIDGFYRTKGTIAEQTIEFLVDTGASSVTMSGRTARKLGLHDFVHKGVSMKCNTFNQMNINCYKITLPSVQVGCIKLFNVDATVMEGENDEVLLGASFIDRLNWNKKDRLLELQAN